MKIIRANQLPPEFFEYKPMQELDSVNEIIWEVQHRGDDALMEYSRKFDGVEPERFRVRKEEIASAVDYVTEDALEAFRQVAANIQNFSELQQKQLQSFEIEINPGVITGQQIIPIERVGIYVPGGSFPLVSTLLMCAIPAQVAGVKEIVLCSPPSFQGSIHPAILSAAGIIGIDEIYQVGGVQAIAAMAYGTPSIKKVHKIVGPGNKYVTQAKKEVFGIVGIDFIAGPTEILIIADDSADPEILAADLLAQAEHDVDAVPIMVTASEKLAQRVTDEVNMQLEHLPTAGIAALSVKNNGLIILVSTWNKAIELANRKAPEHLELQVREPEKFVSQLRNYGSLFIGEYASEVLGDYSSGINHTLPTNTAARYTGGLSIKDFVKIQTTLKVNEKGLHEIGPIAEIMAETEGLWGHKNSIKIRRAKLKKE